MSWLFSQALVAEYSAATSSDGTPSAPLSGMPTPLAYLPQDRMTEFSKLSRYGVTFAPLTENLGEELLMWFLEVSLARISHLPEMVPASMARYLDYGEKWPESSEKYDLNSHSWKIHHSLFPVDLHWSSVILPKWGMSANGCVYRHPRLERPITATEAGLLPTPSGVNGGRNNVMGRIDEWGGSGNPFRGTEIGRMRCANFEEWMMGWPMGWSELTPLEMDKFHLWQKQHSKC